MTKLISCFSDRLVTVVTPTTGADFLLKAVESVKNQTYKHIQHLVYVDGIQHHKKVKSLLDEELYNSIDIIVLPYSTGEDRYNGHRIYGSAPYLCKGDYICFLDEDNWFDETHIESLVDTIEGNHWAFSLRKIVGKNGEYICNDDCECLGTYPSVMTSEDYFVDVNCFFLTKEVALQTSPVWYRKAREPGVPEVDRFLTHVLRNNNLKYDCSGEYTVNYRVGNTERSVKAEFFLQGNEIMKQRHPGYPWRK